MSPILVITNANGLQGKGVVKCASEAGFHVRAQVRDASKPESQALAKIPNVTLIEGTLEDPAFQSILFKGADYAWVNTTFYSPDETGSGIGLANAAKEAGIKHYLYSTISDHSKITQGRWSVPFFVSKHKVEEYIRTMKDFPATFIMLGGYFQNYLGDWLFKPEKQADGSVLIKAKMSENIPLILLDVEEDLGPVVVKVLKEGPEKWNQKKIPLAFEVVKIKDMLKAFSEASGVKIVYEQIKEPLNPQDPFEAMFAIQEEEAYFDWDCKVPDEARELNPKWHSLEQFSRTKFAPIWKKNHGFDN